MAEFIDDLGYSKENPFSPTREERNRMRLIQKQKQEFKTDVLSLTTLVMMPSIIFLKTQF